MQGTFCLLACALVGPTLNFAKAAPIGCGQFAPHQTIAVGHHPSVIRAGDLDNDWTEAEMWQPPTVVGLDTSIQFAGATLVDRAVYYVRVRVFNDTLWSNWLTAAFRMNSLPTSPSPLFHRMARLHSPVAQVW